MTYEVLRPNNVSAIETVALDYNGGGYGNGGVNAYDNSVGDNTTSAQLTAFIYGGGDGSTWEQGYALFRYHFPPKTKPWKDRALRVVYSTSSINPTYSNVRFYDETSSVDWTVSESWGSITDVTIPRPAGLAPNSAGTVVFKCYSYSGTNDITDTVGADLYDISYLGLVDEQRHFLCM